MFASIEVKLAEGARGCEGELKLANSGFRLGSSSSVPNKRRLQFTLRPRGKGVGSFEKPPGSYGFDSRKLLF